MSTVKEILSAKGTHVETISESADVLNAVKKMNAERIGCLVVTGDDDGVKGIVAERDILRRIATTQEDLSHVPVSQVMTRHVIVCRPTDRLNQMRSTMKTHWVRQIPVVDDEGKLQGIISIGDVNAFLIDEEDVEIKYLHDYIERPCKMMTTAACSVHCHQ